MIKSINVVRFGVKLNINIESDKPLTIFSKQTSFTAISQLTPEQAFQLGTDLIIASGSMVRAKSPSNDQKSHQ